MVAASLAALVAGDKGSAALGGDTESAQFLVPDTEAFPANRPQALAALGQHGPYFVIGGEGKQVVNGIG
jgi:hypothetical protein